MRDFKNLTFYVDYAIIILMSQVKVQISKGRK